MVKKSFLIWVDISIFMFFVVFVDFLMFETFAPYCHTMRQVNVLFVTIFVFTIFISIFLLGEVFKKYGYQIRSIKEYLKLYFSILWRALVFVIPVVGLIAFVFKGSVFSRLLTIFIEFLVGFPAIYWYLKTIQKTIYKK